MAVSKANSADSYSNWTDANGFNKNQKYLSDKQQGKIAGVFWGLTEMCKYNFGEKQEALINFCSKLQKYSMKAKCARIEYKYIKEKSVAILEDNKKLNANFYKYIRSLDRIQTCNISVNMDSNNNIDQEQKKINLLKDYACSCLQSLIVINAIVSRHQAFRINVLKKQSALSALETTSKPILVFDGSSRLILEIWDLFSELAETAKATDYENLDLELIAVRTDCCFKLSHLFALLFDHVHEESISVKPSEQNGNSYETVSLYPYFITQVAKLLQEGKLIDSFNTKKDTIIKQDIQNVLQNNLCPKRSLREINESLCQGEVNKSGQTCLESSKKRKLEI